MIYLDHNATTPIKRACADILCATLHEVGNGSSVHAAGRAARMRIEHARAQVAALCGANAPEVAFTSGATEANNTVLQAFAGKRVLVGATEHPSVLEAAPKGVRIPVHSNGLIDLEAYERLLADTPPALVSVMLVNNETGVIQPIAQIAALAHAAGALMHCDAVQGAGRITVDMAALGADYLSLSAHKIGGPQGVGALVANPSAPRVKLLYGGGQERSARAGTENVPAIAAFGQAAALAVADLDTYQQLEPLRNQLEAALEGAYIFGREAMRVANTCCFAYEGPSADVQMMALDLKGVCVSSGSACSSGKIKASHVLGAMGVDDKLAQGALRISLGWSTTQDDINEFITIYKGLRASWHK